MITRLPFITNTAGPSTHDNKIALALYDLIARHELQQRIGMTWNSILAKAAQQHAEDMAVNDYFSHVDPDGFGPNYRIRQAGYKLPDGYGNENQANNCESIAAGQATPEICLDGWMHSESHRSHVLGTINFYAEQTHAAVGYAYLEDTTYWHYWVFLSA